MDELIAKLKTPEECIVFEKNVTERGRPDLALAARKRAVELRAISYGAKNDVERECLCSDLMYPDTDLGENARHGEVFDEQAETYVFPGVQTAGSMSGVGSRI